MKAGAYPCGPQICTGWRKRATPPTQSLTLSPTAHVGLWTKQTVSLRRSIPCTERGRVLWPTLRVIDGNSRSGVIDEELLAGRVLLAQHYI